MLRILGKPSSINVRKVLWLCDEIGVPFEFERLGERPAFLAHGRNGSA